MCVPVCVCVCVLGWAAQRAQGRGWQPARSPQPAAGLAFGEVRRLESQGQEAGGVRENRAQMTQGLGSTVETDF